MGFMIFPGARDVDSCFECQWGSKSDPCLSQEIEQRKHEAVNSKIILQTLKARAEIPDTIQGGMWE